MSRIHRSVFSYALLSLFVFVMAGCGSKESKWLGSYQSTHGQLQLKGDHKATLNMEGTSSDATWEMVNDDKIIVHFGIPIELFKTSSGLRDQEGTDWKKK